MTNQLLMIMQFLPLEAHLGNLEAAYHIFGYLKKHLDMDHLAFDPKAPEIQEQHFHNNAD